MPKQSMHVASLLFDKRVFTPRQAGQWAHHHGFKALLVEVSPTGRYIHVPQRATGRVKRVISLGGAASGIRAIVARNPGGRSLWKIRTAFKYQYAPGVLDRFDPTTVKGRPIAPGTWVRMLAKRPAGGRTIAGWGRTFAWIADEHGNEQIVFRRALHKR